MEYNKNFYQIHSNDDIFQRIQNERETIGYYDLPYQDTSDIKAYAKTIAQKHIVVVGIGGSSLGVKAIYGFLLPSNKYQKNLVFLETLDPLEINHCLTKFDIFDAHFVVISKSGSTIETISFIRMDLIKILVIFHLVIISTINIVHGQ
jgi:glucose-6-phosphate isomerase